MRTENPTYDIVNHPYHYNQSSIECIDAMLSAFGVKDTATFCKLNCFKYLWRSGFKGKDQEDMKKADWYLDKYNELMYNERMDN